MPKAPAMASPTADATKSFNVDAPSFVFDPSKAFTALPASNLPTKDKDTKKKKAKNPETEVTEERSTSAKRSRNRKKAAAATVGEVQATEYKAKSPADKTPQAPIPMPQAPQPTQAVKSGYTNRHKQAATETSAVDEEKARITAEKEVRAKKVYTLDFMLTLKNDNKQRPVNMALLDFPHKKRRAEFRKMPLSEVDKFNQSVGHIRILLNKLTASNYDTIQKQLMENFEYSPSLLNELMKIIFMKSTSETMYLD